MENGIRKFWDKQAKRYDDAEKQFAPVYEDILAKTSKYLDLNDNVLDFGCATGNKTIKLANHVKHIHGLDISGEMIGRADRKKNELNISNASFSRGTIFNLDLEQGSFDKIIAFAIIHLLEDKEKAIQRIYELLKPGGLFISTTACMRDKMTFKNRVEVTLYLFIKKMGIFPLHLNMFRPADVEKLFTDHDFKIVEAERITHGMPAIFIIARK